MKKLGIFCFMTMFAMFVMASCGGGAGTNAQDKSIEEKIENGEDLSADDYSHMINYVGEFAEKAQDLVPENGEASEDELAQLREEYPYLDTFRECLKITPIDKLHDYNIKEVAKYAGLTEFSVPIGYSLTTDPEAAGIEVAVPDSANGVVAGAVDTVKIKK